MVDGITFTATVFCPAATVEEGGGVRGATATKQRLAAAAAAAAAVTAAEDEGVQSEVEDLKSAALEAVRQAAAEGLELERSADNICGFLGVSHNGPRRFRARLSNGHGGMTNLGTFATAEEAALAVARRRGVKRAREV